ncbi:hypothetical protein B0H11DRAFT_2281255 [Mycena galericulata]|nr:hypothetical protein B0H11DRAFT_2284416 [Mycena galericulata]KAJ7477825.1 hypothetical protein B0H11DRAFT_2281255 [Mycena galericulata]
MTTIPYHWLAPTPPRPSQVSRPETDDEENGSPDNGLLPLRLQQPSGSDGSSSLSMTSPSAERSSHNPRKRAAEDLGQYADQVARKLRLTTEAQEELKSFTQLPAPRQSVWIAAHMLAGNNQISSLVPAESVYRIPTDLEGHIDQTTFLALVDHQAFNYVYIEKHASWGLTARVKSDKSKFSVIKLRIRDKLTQYRNLLKGAIEESMVPPGEPVRKDALNVLVLCQRILAVGAKVAPDVKVSMEMAARVAYLRFHYKLKVDARLRFWDDVDKGLAEVRETTRGNREELSRLFSRSLSDDLKIYGQVKLDHLTAVSPALLA